jgi:lysophospholipid acyltransferase
MTFVISAFWHGFYPGYYLFFLSGAPFQFLAQVVSYNLRPFFCEEKSPLKFLEPLYNIVAIIAVNAILGYMKLAFDVCFGHYLFI